MRFKCFTKWCSIAPRNYLLSIVNPSESAFRHITNVILSSNHETIASHEYDNTDDCINSMTQNKSTTIKSHSNEYYAPLPEPFRNDQPMQFIAELQTRPTILFMLQMMK